MSSSSTSTPTNTNNNDDVNTVDDESEEDLSQDARFEVVDPVCHPQFRLTVDLNSNLKCSDCSNITKMDAAGVSMFQVSCCGNYVCPHCIAV